VQVASITNFQQKRSPRFFFLFVLLLMGVIGCHHQVLAKGELAPPLFLFLVFRCHHQLSVEGELSSLYSCSFLLLLQHHHQLSVEGEHAPSFIFLSFVVFRMPLPRFGRNETYSPFFIVFVISGAYGQVLAKKKLKLPPFFLFSSFFSFGRKSAPLPSVATLALGS